MPGGTEVLERTRVAQVETGKNGRCGTARNHGEFRLDARCDGEHDPEQTCASGLMHSRGAMHRIGWAAALLVAFCAHAHAARATKPDAEVLSACISATLSKAARSSYPSKRDNVVYVLPDEEKYAASLSDDQLRVDLRDPANWSTLRALFQNLRDRAGKGWRPPKNIAVSGFRIKIANPPLRDNLFPSFDHLYYSFYPPGYSADGRSSVVNTAFGPTPHGASANCELSLQDGKWIVVNSWISIYA